MPSPKKVRGKSEVDLSVMRLRFVEEYLMNGEVNGADAARKAGVPAKSAKKRAHEWLSMPEVQAEIEAWQEERSKYVMNRAADVLEEAKIITKASILDVVSIQPDGTCRIKKNIPDHVRRAIRKISTKVTKKILRGRDEFTEDEEILTIDVSIEMHDKGKTIQLLAQNLGMLQTKVEHSGKLGLLDVLRAAMEEPPEED